MDLTNYVRIEDPCVKDCMVLATDELKEGLARIQSALGGLCGVKTPNPFMDSNGFFANDMFNVQCVRLNGKNEWIFRYVDIIITWYKNFQGTRVNKNLTSVQIEEMVYDCIGSLYYDAVLIESELGAGNSVKQFREALSFLPNDNIYTLNLAGFKNADSEVMGFITDTAFLKIDFSEEVLMSAITPYVENNDCITNEGVVVTIPFEDGDVRIYLTTDIRTLIG